MTAKPLTEYPAGSTVTVSEICGGCRARSRLLALGITPGCPVEVLSHGGGPVKIRVRGCDLVMGHGECEKVLALSGDGGCPIRQCVENNN
ncbi:FeoA family protein [Desulfovibrio oxyclinae]|uniref:FeoA family protein n=1 Tax=Desulfovibrio oxyclinae TaxID=63560 RepID=UPI00037D28EC|nr:FeoA family protein [Desulfovibrio oxyclinae]